LIDRCAGIDVGQALLVACARVVDEKGQLTQGDSVVGATTPDLLALRDWLAEAPADLLHRHSFIGTPSARRIRRTSGQSSTFSNSLS
jgi:hypothetical protein